MEFHAKARIVTPNEANKYVVHARPAVLKHDAENQTLTMYFKKKSDGVEKLCMQPPILTKDNLLPVDKRTPPQGCNYIIKFNRPDGVESHYCMTSVDRERVKELHDILVSIVGVVPPGQSISYKVEVKRRALENSGLNKRRKTESTCLQSSNNAENNQSAPNPVAVFLGRKTSVAVDEPLKSSSTPCVSKSVVEVEATYGSCPTTALSDRTKNVAVRKPLKELVSSSMPRIPKPIEVEATYGPVAALSDRKKPVALREPVTELVSLSTPRIPKFVEVEATYGLPNIGNSCYINAILQVFFNLEFFEKLRSFVLRKFKARLLEKDDLTKNAPICYALFNVCREKDDKRERLIQLRDRINEQGKFSGKYQEDAHEFLVFLFDCLESEMRKILCRAKKESIVDLAGGADDDRCLVSDYFAYQIERVYRCCECSASETTMFENGNHFILQPSSLQLTEIARETSIYDILLNLLCNDDEVTKSKKCDNCGGAVRKVRQCFKKYPRYIVLMLQRYSYDAQSNRRSKIGEPIYVNRQLSFTELCSRSAATSAAPSQESPPRATLARALVERSDENRFATPKSSGRPDSAFSPSVGFGALSLRSRLGHEVETLEAELNETSNASPFFSDDEDFPTHNHAFSNLNVSAATAQNVREASFSDDDCEELSVLKENMASPKAKLPYRPVGFAWRHAKCAALGILNEMVRDRIACPYDRYRVCDQREVFFSRIQAPENLGYVSGDGNCLFRALSHVVTGGSEDAHSKIRAKICDFLEAYSEKFKCYANELEANFSDYVRRMRHSGEWGSQAELFAFATLTQTPIYTYLDSNWICYEPRFILPTSSNRSDARDVVWESDDDDEENRHKAKNNLRTPSRVKLADFRKGEMIYLSNSGLHFEPVLSVLPTLSYKIRGVVNHLGESMETGHYLAMLRTKQPEVRRTRSGTDFSAGGDNWLKCDDSTVVPIAEEKALEECSTSGYIFFYEKTLLVQKI